MHSGKQHHQQLKITLQNINEPFLVFLLYCYYFDFQNIKHMQNPYYGNNRQFMPSNETLNQWMKTRKTQNTSIPGLFETIGFATDQIWSFIAIIIESAALFLTTYGAWQMFQANHKLPLFITAIILVVLFIAFDIIGIMLHGYESPRKVEIKNILVKEKDYNERKRLIDELESITWRQFLGTMLFLLSAALKIVAILVYFKTQAGMIVIAILTIFYLVVIYIHLYHTGYWLSALKTKKLLTREEEEWYKARQTDVSNPFQVNIPDLTLFSTRAPIPFPGDQKKYDFNRATISFLQEVNHEDGSKSFDYKLENNGCLWDEDIHGLIANFPSEFSKDLIEACKTLQLSQLHT